MLSNSHQELGTFVTTPCWILLGWRKVLYKLYEKIRKGFHGKFAFKKTHAVNQNMCKI